MIVETKTECSEKEDKERISIKRIEEKCLPLKDGPF